MKRKHSPIVAGLLFAVLCVFAARAFGGFNLIAVAITAGTLAWAITEICLQLIPSPAEDGEEFDQEAS